MVCSGRKKATIMHRVQAPSRATVILLWFNGKRPLEPSLSQVSVVALYKGWDWQKLQDLQNFAWQAYPSFLLVAQKGGCWTSLWGSVSVAATAAGAFHSTYHADGGIEFTRWMV